MVFRTMDSVCINITSYLLNRSQTFGLCLEENKSWEMYRWHIILSNYAKKKKLKYRSIFTCSQFTWPFLLKKTKLYIYIGFSFGWNIGNHCVLKLQRLSSLHCLWPVSPLLDRESSTRLCGLHVSSLFPWKLALPSFVFDLCTDPKQYSLLGFYFASSPVMINCLKNSFSSPEKHPIFFLLLPASCADSFCWTFHMLARGGKKVVSEDGTNTWLAVLSLTCER